jgi:dipeptidase E
MTVFLTSSPTGPLDRSRAVNGIDGKNRLIENLKERWRPKARCLLVAAAPGEPEQNDAMCRHLRQALEQSGLSTGAFDVWDDRTGALSKETLREYDVVVLGGGHVPTQNAFFHRIGLGEKLQGFGGLVIGISAGTMNSADVVYAQPELDGESTDPTYRRFLPGLGLTRLNVLPHYQMVRDTVLDGKRLFQDITYPDSAGRRFVALVDGSYILCEGGRQTVWGEAYQIADGVLTPLCAEGETLAL